MADVLRLPTFPEPFEFPPGATQETRYLAGQVFDCRGSRVMGGADLKIFLDVPKFSDEAFARLAYWASSQRFELGLDAVTFLTGVFSIMIGTGARPKNDYPDALYTISAVDSQTNDVRIRSTLRIPAEGHMVVLLFPPSRE